MRRRSPISVSCRSSPMRAASASMSRRIRVCSRPKPPPRRCPPSPTPHRRSSPMPSKAAAPITIDAVYAAPGYLFRRMQQIAVSIFMEECKAFDLTPVQYAALIAIHTHPGIDATRLSAVIAFDRSTLGSVIERLQAKDFIERKPAPEDKRIKLLYLTNEASRVPLRAEDALEHLGKAG